MPPIQGFRGREMTGATCARWLAQRCVDQAQPLPSYTVHSQNPVGAANITAIMASASRL